MAGPPPHGSASSTSASATQRVVPTLACTPFGTAAGDVVVTDGRVTEGISVPSSARIGVVTKNAVDAEAAIGTSAILTLTQGSTKRQLAFVVTGVDAVDLEQGARSFAIELEHPFATLRYRSDVRTFLERTTRQIIEEVLAAAGIPAGDLTWQATRGTAVRTWCVQFGETDFDFVSRLLEEEGIFYLCPDDASSGKLLFGDAPSVFTAVDTASGNGEIPFSFESHGLGIDELSIEHRVTTGAVSLADYAFETPGLDLTSRASLDDTPAGELFEYPGRFTTQGDGSAIAKIRAEELASGKVSVTGLSGQGALRAGAWFVLTSDNENSPKGKYLLRRVQHDFTSSRYGNTFEGSPFDLPFRPARTTPRPAARGTFTTTVTGPSGQEIHTDKYGRMKGLFAFDRVRSEGETASPWMRLAQPALGGSMMLARIGWEMAVRHLDGDPDRPIVVARMYDGAHVAPETLPSMQTKTSFETLSSPRGEKINAVTIDDKSGAMLFEVKAGKDLDATILHDETETIGENDTLTVGKDETQLVGDKQTITVEKDDTAKAAKDAGLAVAGNRSKSLKADETATIEGGESVRVDGKDDETVGANLSIATSQEMLESTKGTFDKTVAGAVASKSGKDYTVYVAGSSSEVVGGAKSIQSSDGTLVDATTGNVTIMVGGARVETVSGNRVATAQGDASRSVGAISSITAAGKLQLKAKTIKITVSGAATLLGGGGIVSLTPASVAFVGTLTLKGSGGVEIVGAPQLVG